MKPFLLGVAALISSSVVTACTSGPVSMVPSVSGFRSSNRIGSAGYIRRRSQREYGSRSFVSSHAATDREASFWRTGELE